MDRNEHSPKLQKKTSNKRMNKASQLQEEAEIIHPMQDTSSKPQSKPLRSEIVDNYIGMNKS